MPKTPPDCLDWLYFESKKIKNEYSAQLEPGSVIDVARLLQGRPCFKKTKLSRATDQKTLLLTAWNISLWSVDKRQQIEKKLDELLDKNFKIYLFINDQFVLLTKEMLNKEEILKKCPLTLPVDHKTFTEYAISKNTAFTQDNLAILDDTTIPRLLHAKSPIKERWLYLSELRALPADKLIPYLIDFKKCDPAVTHIIDDVYPSIQNDRVMHAIKEQFTAIDIEQKYQTITLNQQEIMDNKIQALSPLIDQALFESCYIEINRQTPSEEAFKLFFDQLPEPRSLHCRYCDVANIDDLAMQALQCIVRQKKLKILDIWHSHITVAQLSQLLSQAENLEGLDLSGCENLTDSFDNAWNLSQLKTLHVRYSNITATQLSQLLSQAKDLEVLDLSGCENLTADLFGDQLNLSKLKTLDVEYSQITAAQLSQLLLRAENLEGLYLYGCENLTDSFDNALNLSKLKKLYVNFSIPVAQLSQLLSRAENLEVLSLFECQNLTADLFGDQLNLSQLKALDVRNSNITVAQLSQLLSRAKDLEVLDLSSCKNLTNSFNNALNLSKLKKLNAGDSHITATQLSQLLSRAKDLEVLNLYGCKNLTDSFCNTLNLSNLKKLDVRNSNITVAQLSQLLSRAKDLEVLDLYGCKNLTDSFCNTLNLSNLKKLDVRNSNITVAQLSQLLSRAKDLEVLDLYGCKNLTADPFGDQLNLSQLKVLNVGNSKITTAQLSQLLLRAENLEELDLYGCKNLTGSFDNILNLSKLKTLDVRDSNITATQLSQLRSKAKDLVVLNNPPTYWRQDTAAPIGRSSLTTGLVSLTGTATAKQDHPQPAVPAKETTLDMARASADTKESFSPPDSGEMPISVVSDNSSAGTADAQPSPSTETPKYDMNTFFNDTPHDKDTPITFQHNVNQKNQAAIVNALSRYIQLASITVTDHFLSKIQDGVCYALTQHAKIFFAQSTNTLQTWQDHLKDIAQWDGEFASLTDAQKTSFDQLITDITKYQFSFSSNDSYTYIHNNDHRTDLKDFLSQGVDERTLINPLHAIFIKKNTAGWILYDPNDPKGGRDFKHADALAAAIKESMGPNIAISDDNRSPAFIPSQTMTIDDADSFIQHGGLLFFERRIKNWSDIIEAYFKLHKENLPNSDILSGLLMCDFKKPAFFRSLQQPLAAEYTLFLLERFMEENNDWWHQLSSKMAYILNNEANKKNNPLEILNFREAIAGLKKKYPQYQKTLGRLLTLIPDQIHAQDRSDTDASLALLPITPVVDNTLPSIPLCPVKTWMQQVTSRDLSSKTLLTTSTAVDTHHLGLSLEAYLTNIHAPFFHIHSPDDLCCPAMKLSTENGQTKLVSGQGGPLYNFLTQQHSATPRLIINYDAFQPDDIVRLNTILDKSPQIDGVSFSGFYQIIGLLNTANPNCYRGLDFYSRFDKQSALPATTDVLKTYVDREAPNTITTGETIAAPDDQKIVIDLYHHPEWRNNLFGQWNLENNHFVFKTGALVDALEKQKQNPNLKMTLMNLPEHTEVAHYLREASHLGYVYHAGQKIDLTGVSQKPPYFNISIEEGYEFQALCEGQTFKRVTSCDVTTHPLNSETLSSFFKQIGVDKAVCNIQCGLLEAQRDQHPNEALQLTLTAPLKEDEWARLLSEAKRLSVRLSMNIPHDTLISTLPDSIREKILSTDMQEQQDTQKKSYAHTCFYSTDDSQYAIQQLIEKTILQDNSPPLVFDISECHATHLLSTIQIACEKNDQNHHIQLIASQTEQALLRALKEEKTVIVKGNFTETLVNGLTPFLFQRLLQEETPAQDLLGKLILMPDSASASLFHFLTDPQSINNPDPKPAPDIQALIQLSPKSLQQALENPIYSCDFHQHRLNAVEAILKDAPYVYLAGLSGVGKTTFVTEQWSQYPHQPCHLYPNVLDWIQAKDGGYLFVDEENLEENRFSMFEGLFNKPPGILYQGTYYPLTEKHKVIFAGNPKSYGEGREIAPLFKHHGNIVIFDPLPPAVIKASILEPILKAIAGGATDDLYQPFLELYRFFGKHSTSELLISGRELATIACLTKNSLARLGDNHPDPCAFAQAYVYKLGQSLAPIDLKERFNEAFKDYQADYWNILKKYAAPISKDFLFTPSRYPILQLLGEMITLHEAERDNRNKASDSESIQAQRIRAMNIEGEAGIGKSEMIVHYLTSQKYEEERQFALDVNNPEFSTKLKPFYRIPASLDLDQKKRALVKAHYEGAIVILDEINSTPALEALLNALLMNTVPQEFIIPNHTPRGMMIIGTQNPRTYRGRYAISTALQRRMIQVTADSYTHSELVAMLMHQHQFSEKTAATIVNDYTASNQDEKNTTRELLRKAQEYATNHPKETHPACYCEETELATTLQTMRETALQEMQEKYISPAIEVKPEAVLPAVPAEELPETTVLAEASTATSQVISCAENAAVPQSNQLTLSAKKIDHFYKILYQKTKTYQMHLQQSKSEDPLSKLKNKKNIVDELIEQCGLNEEYFDTNKKRSCLEKFLSFYNTRNVDMKNLIIRRRSNDIFYKFWQILTYLKQLILKNKTTTVTMGIRGAFFKETYEDITKLTQPNKASHRR